MKHFFRKPLIPALLSALAFSACSNDDNEQPNAPIDSANAYYIVNEGNFGSGNGNITYYNFTDPDSVKTEIDYFKKANNRALGDVVQSLAFNNGKGFILVNGSSKIEVVDSATFTSVATISSIGSPRFFKAVSADKGYITDWVTNQVHIIDLTSYAVTGTIPVATGPEQIILHGQKAYVSNTGGYGDDSLVSVINTVTNTPEGSIAVGIKPSAMQLDKDNNLWVLCTGRYGGYNGIVDLPGELVRINLATNEVTLRLPMPAATDHPTVMAMSPARDFLYYILNDKIYKMNVADTALPETAFVAVPGKVLYGITVSPKNGDVLTTEAISNANGQLHVYDSNGNPKGSVSSGGMFPNGIIVR